MKKEALLSFPCSFPIKVMGLADPAFEALVLTIVDKYLADSSDKQVRSQSSGKQKYISLTITITAQNQQQLDNIYQELSAHPAVLMAL